MTEICPVYLDYVKVLFYVRRWQVLKWIVFSIIPYMFILLYYRFPEEKEVPLATMAISRCCEEKNRSRYGRDCHLR